MTQTDFLNRLGMLAKVTEFHLTKEWVALYDRALSKFGYDKAAAAVEAAIMERRGNERMPSIGDLVQRCAPQVLDADTAVEVAGRIWGAISKFGWSDPLGARDWIGEVGWHIIETNGGWQSICATAQAKDVGTWRAQLRDHAAAAIRRHKAGVLGVAPRFGEVANDKVAALVGEVLSRKEVLDGSPGNARSLSRPSGDRLLDAEDNSRVPQTLQG